MAAPPPTDNYPVDATRPLLAEEALLLGVAAATPSEEDHLVDELPAAPAEDEEVGMDKLFNRLRHRKQERIQTGELLVNRRLQSPTTPGADTGEIAGPLPSPKERKRRRSAGSETDAQSPTPQAAAMSPDPDATDEPLPPTWEATEQEDVEVAPAAGTADFLAALASEEAMTAEAESPLPDAAASEGTIDDSWLTALVDEEATVVSEWGAADPATVSPPAVYANGTDPAQAAPAAEPSFAELLAYDIVLSESPASEPSRPEAAAESAAAEGWDTVLPNRPLDDMPEHPEPPTSSRSSADAGDDTPHWGDEALDEALSTSTPAPINGQHTATEREPQDSVVMRVRTTGAITDAAQGGSRPLTAAGVANKHTRPSPRQTEQLAQLTALVESQPENYFARLTLAVAYVSSRQPEEGLNEYRRLIKESDELVPEVIERLKEMIADGDAPSRAHRVLGDAYMKLGQFDLAMAEFQRALTTRLRVAK